MKKRIFKLIALTVFMQIFSNAGHANTPPLGYYSYGKCSSKGWLSMNYYFEGFGATPIQAETAVFQRARGFDCFNHLSIVRTEPYYEIKDSFSCVAACKGYGLFEGPKLTSSTIGLGFNLARAEAISLLTLNQYLSNGQIHCANPATKIIKCERLK